MTRKLWTEEERAVIREHYPDKQTKELLPLLPGRTERMIYQQAAAMGVKKSAAFFESDRAGRIKRGVTAAAIRNQFKPGHEPFNKGKKGKEYLKPEALAGMHKTTFKKGQAPHNTLPEGTITVRNDKRGKPYQFYHTGKSNLPLHVHNWTLAHGKPPRGHCVVFKDGDTMKADISNLELITRAENMKRNTYHNWPKPLAKMVQLRGALNRKINNKLKAI